MDANTASVRSATVTRILQATAPRMEPEVEEAQDAVKESRPAMPAPMLDLRLKDGSIVSLNYAYLRRVDFAPGDVLTLRFADGAIVIAQGRNLRRIREQVRLHRANEIREGTNKEEALKGADEAHIDAILILEKEEQ